MSETGTNRGNPPDPNEPWLPPRAHGMVERAKRFWQRSPVAVKLFAGALLLTITAVAAYHLVEPIVREDAVLFSQLDPEDAGGIVEKLKTQQIPYSLTGDGTTIRVPKDRVHELRLQLASEGLPRGGQVGFESFEKLRLGATEFEQHVTYRRAMEGELARTIASVRSVRSARVHLVLPKRSVFTKKQAPASASVVVQLNGGTLLPNEVQGVVGLVASAVAGLEPDSVALVTTEGTMLHRPKRKVKEGEEEVGTEETDQNAQTRALEALLEERTRTMLERVLGAGHVDVRISADVDTAKIEKKSDLFDPVMTALRSEQQLVEQASGGVDGVVADTVAGVPGAEANLPGGAGLLGEEGEIGGATRRSHTRNYEINRIQERRVSVTQSVKRLAVAVVVDGVKTTGPAGAEQVVPRTREELDKLTTLVRSAVGFDEDRGDSVTVESVPFFIEPAPEELAEEPPLLPIPEAQRALIEPYMPLARTVGIGLAGLIALLWVRKRWKKRSVANKAKRLKAEKKFKELAAARIEAAAPTDPVDYRVARRKIRRPPLWSCGTG